MSHIVHQQLRVHAALQNGTLMKLIRGQADADADAVDTEIIISRLLTLPYPWPKLLRRELVAALDVEFKRKKHDTTVNAFIAQAVHHGNAVALAELFRLATAHDVQVHAFVPQRRVSRRCFAVMRANWQRILDRQGSKRSWECTATGAAFAMAAGDPGPMRRHWADLTSYDHAMAMRCALYAGQSEFLRSHLGQCRITRFALEALMPELGHCDARTLEILWGIGELREMFVRHKLQTPLANAIVRLRAQLPEDLVRDAETHCDPVTWTCAELQHSRDGGVLGRLRELLDSFAADPQRRAMCTPNNITLLMLACIPGRNQQAFDLIASMFTKRFLAEGYAVALLTHAVQQRWMVPVQWVVSTRQLITSFPSTEARYSAGIKHDWSPTDLLVTNCQTLVNLGLQEVLCAGRPQDARVFGREVVGWMHEQGLLLMDREVDDASRAVIEGIIRELDAGSGRPVARRRAVRDSRRRQARQARRSSRPCCEDVALQEGQLLE